MLFRERSAAVPTPHLQQTFFRLLQYSIGVAQSPPQPPTPAEWQVLYDMAKRQEITGVILQGISRLPKDYPPPPIALLMKWVGEGQMLQAMNERLFQRTSQVCQRLNKDGFQTCILKGQGNALLYPNPFSRTPGDIDVWLSGGRERIVAYVDEHYPGQQLRYHHIDLPLLSDTSVEAHFTPSYLNEPRHNRRLQAWFHEQAEEQFAHHVPWPVGEEPIPVPTPQFNLVFILSHLYRHVFTEGIGLRQLLDYHFTLHHPVLTPEHRSEAMRIIRHTGMAYFCAAIMHVLHHAFALPQELMLCPPHAREGERLLAEVMRGGNFGMHDDTLGAKRGQGKLLRNLRMELHNATLLFRYPSEALCEPLFRTRIYIRRKIQGRK